ncbi:MAG: hypothetical protein AB4041_02410 [Microcystaceae cyanobacterium]
MTSEVDIGIIIALREEFRELYRQIPSPQAFKDEETGVTDYLFQWGSSAPYQCATTFVGGMGNEKAALATERFIKRCQPRTIVLLGIAGGIGTDVKLGDVVVVQSVNNYLTRGKAVSGENESFTFEAGGDPYRCSDDLVRAVQDIEFAHHKLYEDWQENSEQRLKQSIKGEQLGELLSKDYIREKTEMKEGTIASGPVVGAAKEFIDWLKKIDRNYLGLEMEGGGVLGAVYSQANPKKTLILRGISDFGDERKKELDAIGKGGFRRYAMNNAIDLLWKLLEADILPKNQALETRTTEKSAADISPSSKYDLQRATIYGLASESQGGNVVSGQNVQGNTIIGTQNNYGTLSPPPASGNVEALELWTEKLAVYRREEAIASDPEKKFQLKQLIEECQQKIRELGG